MDALLLLAVAVALLFCGCEGTRCKARRAEEHEHNVRLPCKCEDSITALSNLSNRFNNDDIKCETAVIAWKNGSTPIATCTRDGVTILVNETFGTIDADESLLIYEVSLSDAAGYECERTHPQSTDTYLTQLEIEVPPTQVDIKPPSDIWENVSVDFECVIERALPILPVDIYWELQDVKQEGGQPHDSSLNDDGTYKLTYRKSFIFSKEHHNERLSCLTTWYDAECDSAYTDLLVIHEPRDVPVASNTTEYPEGAHAGIKCDVGDCYPENQNLVLMQSTEEIYSVTGKVLYYPMIMHRGDNMLPLSCCAETDDAWEEVCSASALVPNVTFPPENLIASFPNMPQPEGLLMFNCSTDSSNPNSTIKWTLGENLIEDGVTEMQLPGEHQACFVYSSLQLLAECQSNGLDLKCAVVYKGVETRQKTTNMNITFHSTDITFDAPGSLQPEHTVVTYKCSGGSSNPPSQVLWTLATDIITENITHKLLEGDCSGYIVESLLYLKVERDMDGEMLHCDIIYDGTSVAEKEKEVRVAYPPTVVVDVDQVVNEGDKVTVRCAATGGNPETKGFEWKHHRKYEMESKFECYEESCDIVNIDRSFAGEYECNASNEFYRASGKGNLTVQYTPTFSQETTTLYGAIGDNLPLDCGGEALPYDDVIFNWTHTGENGTILLDTFYGYSTAPELIGCNYTLYNLDRYSYGSVNCTASNALGTGIYSTQKFAIHQRGRPGVPVNFQVDEMTAKSAWLSWESNLNGGSEQYFVVYYKEICNGCEEFIRVPGKVEDPGLDNLIEYKVTGLNESTEYEFQVMAINSYNGTQGNTSSTLPIFGKTLELPYMDEDADEATVQYDNNAEVATFSWDLPNSELFCYSGQRVRIISTQSSMSERDPQECDDPPYKCYEVNIPETTTTLNISRDEFESSDFDHLLLQLDDVVLITPFAVAESSGGGGLSAGEIVGIVFGTLAFIALIVLAVILGMRIYEDRKGLTYEESTDNDSLDSGVGAGEEAVYAKVNKAKKTPKPAAAAATGDAIYAKPNKKNKKGKKYDQGYDNRAFAGDTYENCRADEALYENTSFPQKKQNPTDPTLHYATLDFPPPKSRHVDLSDIHRCEEPVAYASIQFGKVGPPPEPEIEEEPIWESLPPRRTADEGWAEDEKDL